MITYVVMLKVVANALQGTRIASGAPFPDLIFGSPLAESDTLPPGQRRVAFIDKFTKKQLEEIVSTHVPTASIVDSLPDDWVFQT